MLDQIRCFYSVSRENIFFIGDKYTDEKAAKNAGIKYSFINKL